MLRKLLSMAVFALIFAASAVAQDGSVTGTVTDANTGETTTLDIQLEQSVSELEEVVVTGTGTVERGNLTSSISTISSEDLDDVTVTSTDALLQGKAAGVTVTSASGTPGSGVRVRIRGNSSISASNEPLYIVDGVPLTTGDFVQFSPVVRD